MTKIRILVTISTVFIVGAILYVMSLFARGYRFNLETLSITPNGLLVIKSDPDGAQVFVNGELQTATNATIPLPPDTYDVTIQKEGYITWSKRLVIEQEIVTEATAHLFKSAPSLSASTFSGVTNPAPSRDFSKIAYVVPPETPTINGNSENSGLWIVELVNLPLGFSGDPRRITDGDLTDSSYEWSPDGREILLTTPEGIFLLDSGTFTSQAQRVNVAATKDEILSDWETELNDKFEAQIKKLPNELQDIMRRKVSEAVFAPDGDMVLYTANADAKIPNNLIKQFPAASTQKQERDIKAHHTYIYDIVEDRNFLIDEDSTDLIIKGGTTTNKTRRISWFPTSRHVVLAQKDQIIIMDHDGTNRRNVYSGSFETPHAYPTLSDNRMLILTNLGATSNTPNIYSLSIK